MIGKILNHLVIVGVIFMCSFMFGGCNLNIKEQFKNTVNNIDSQQDTSNVSSFDIWDLLEKSYNGGKSFISSEDDIDIKDVDGKGKNYIFTYNEKIYNATYTKDNWHIKDSYTIKNKTDIIIICQVLTNIHPVHGRDMKSYRTAEDMADEWIIHNIAYNYLPDGNSWKSHAKDVDLNSADQGKSLKEMYDSKINNN